VRWRERGVLPDGVPILQDRGVDVALLGVRVAAGQVGLRAFRASGDAQREHENAEGQLGQASCLHGESPLQWRRIAQGSGRLTGRNLGQQHSSGTSPFDTADVKAAKQAQQPQVGCAESAGRGGDRRPPEGCYVHSGGRSPWYTSTATETGGRVPGGSPSCPGSDRGGGQSGCSACPCSHPPKGVLGPLRTEARDGRGKTSPQVLTSPPTEPSQQRDLDVTHDAYPVGDTVL